MSALVRRVRRFRLGRKARGLLPDRLFLGPVFGVQMRVAGRQRATYLVRFLYAGVLTFIACVGLFSSWVMLEERGGSNAGALQALQTIAPGIVSSIAIFQFVALVLVAPVSLGPSLGDERRTGTLSALLTTPLSALQIVCSRLAAQTAHLIVLTLVAAPLLLAMRVFGGVPAWIIVAITMLCISTAIVGAALSILLSLSARRGASAAASAVFCQILLWIAPPTLSALLQYYGVTVAPMLYMAFCPPVILGLLISQIHGQVFGIPAGFDMAWMITIGYNLAIAACAVLMASVRLRRMLNVAPLPIGQRLSRRMRKLQAAKAAADPASAAAMVEAPVRERATSREVGDRPVLWHELRQGAFTRRWQGIVMLLALQGLLVYLYVKFGINEDGVQFPTMAILTFLLLAAGAARTGTAIAGERESRTWETLCTTPLSAREILLGKLAGILARLWLLPCVLGIHLVVSILAGVLPPVALPLVALGIVPPVLFQSCAGLWFSCQQKKPTSAATLNLGLSALIWMVAPMLLGIIGGLLGGLPGLEWLRHADVLGVLHPMVTVISAVKGGMETMRGNALPYELPAVGDVPMVLFAAVCSVQAIAYLGLAWVFWRMALRRIRVTTARLD